MNHFFRTFRSRFEQLVLVIGLAIFLAGCAAAPPAPENLTALLEENLVYLPHNNLERLVSQMKDKEIVFLGEVHKVSALRQTATELVVALASEKPVVYASESTYTQHPFVEAASLGNMNPLSPRKLPAEFEEFNSRNAPERRILMTTLDLDHYIYGDKEGTVLFLKELANRSSSEAARQQLAATIPELTATKTEKEVHDFLRSLKRVFQQHFDSFPAVDQEEILFSIELLDASNLYYHVPHRHRAPWEPTSSRIRYEYFTKTIDRAYRKAEQRNAILLCRVGFWHAALTHQCEAQYFAKRHPSTKGKVMSIRMIPSYEQSDKVNEEGGDIDTAVTPLMKEGAYCYLSLPQFQQRAKHSLRWSAYYPGGRPICDGLLFVKAVEPDPKPPSQ